MTFPMKSNSDNLGAPKSPGRFLLRGALGGVRKRGKKDQLMKQIDNSIKTLETETDLECSPKSPSVSGRKGSRTSAATPKKSSSINGRLTRTPKTPSNRASRTAPRKSKSINVASPSGQTSNLSASTHSSRSRSIHSSHYVDENEAELKCEDKELTPKRGGLKKTKKSSSFSSKSPRRRRGSAGAGEESARVSSKSPRRVKGSAGAGEESGYSSDGGLSKKKKALRAGAKKQLSKKKSLLDSSAHSSVTSGYSSDGGLATKKRELRVRKSDQAEVKAISRHASVTNLLSMDTMMSPSAVNTRSDADDRPEMMLPPFLSSETDQEIAKVEEKLAAKENLLTQKYKEIADLQRSLDKHKEILRLERQLHEVESGNLKHDLAKAETKAQDLEILQQSDRQDLQKLREEHESLELQLLEEVSRQEQDMTEKKEKESSELQALKKEMERLVAVHQDELSKKDATIQSLEKRLTSEVETSESNGEEGNEAATSSTIKKTKERLQGEVWQLTSNLAEKDEKIEFQKTLISELKEQLIDNSSNKANQSMNQRLTQVESQKREIEARLIDQSKQSKMKLKSKDDAIQFLIEELSRYKDQAEKSSTDSGAGTIGLNDLDSSTKSRTKKTDDDDDWGSSSNHSVGALLSFAGFGRNSGGVRERYERRKNKS